MKAISGWILTILGPDEPDGETYAEVNDILTGRILGDAEDVINDQLPEGYSARVDEASLVRRPETIF